MSETREDDPEELESLLSQAQALQALSDLEGEAAQGTAATARAGYQRLHRAAEQSVLDVQALQERVLRLERQLQHVLLQQDIAAACEAEGCTDVVQLLDKYREEQEQAHLEVARRNDGEEAADKQVEALEQRLKEQSARVADAEEERRAELAPEIKATRDDISLLRNQLAGEQAKAADTQHQVASLAAKLESVQLDMGTLQLLSAEGQEEVARAERQPAAARHAADHAAAALRALREEEQELTDRLQQQEAALQSTEAQGREVVQAQMAAVKAGDKLRGQISSKERLLDEVQKDIEMARLDTEKLLAEQVTLDLEVEKKKAELARSSEASRTEQRGRDTALRRLNRAQMEGEQLQEQLTPLENASQNMRSQLGALQKQGAREAAASGRLQEEVLGMVEQVAAEKKLTELQAALVKASLDAVRQLDEEVADVRAMAAQRERLIQEVASQRDAAGRFASQRTVRLREAISQAEVREVEVEDLRRKRREAKAVHGEVRGLCELMAGQSGRLQGLLAAMRQCAVDLKDQAAEAEGQVVELAGQAGAKAKDLKRTERERVAAEAAQMLASSQLVSERQGRLAAAELADDASIERQRLAWAAAEAAGGVEGLKHVVAATRVAKQETQGALLEADDELCELYERSAGLDGLLGEGAQALLRCEDEMRVLSLEAAELQRRLFATHKTAPDVPRYDRSVARLKTELLQARREVEELGAVLESPKATTGRWRLLPGKNPAPAELEGRITQLEERMEQRCSQAVQKDQILEELAALAEALVAQARASHGGAFDISMRLNESQQALQKLTRRMMAAVSELSLYSALSLKCGADRNALRAELEEARKNIAEGKPPTADADREFERMEQERAGQAEVRAQAAELRRLKEQGLLGEGPPSAASPRPQAYISEELGVPVPFPAAFQPFKPTAPPAMLPRPPQSAGGGARSPGAASPQLSSRASLCLQGSPG